MPLVHPKYKVAVVQATPVWLNLDASIDKKRFLEHLQPLSKYAMYAQNEQVHVAAWPSFSNYETFAPALFFTTAGLSQIRSTKPWQ